MTLSFRLKKNPSSLSSHDSLAMTSKVSSQDYDETEATYLSEEDEGKYGYNSCDEQEPKAAVLASSHRSSTCSSTPTEASVSEEDEAKYGYNSCEDGSKYDHYAHLTKEPDDAAKYGYGEDEDYRRPSTCSSAPSEATIPEEEEAKYGYYDNTCGEDEEDKYDHYAHLTKEPDDAAKYGYGEDSYNYVPLSPVPRSAHTRMPRRSSLKGSNGCSTRMRRCSSLSFSNNVTVSHVTPAQNLAKKKSHLWFEDKDYEKMHKKIFLTVERVREGEQHSQRLCTRGLEKLIRADSTKNRRFAAWDAVLDEQAYQKKSGMVCHDSLSNSYEQVCAESRALATIRAAQDEKAVEGYLSETRWWCRRMSM